MRPKSIGTRTNGAILPEIAAAPAFQDLLSSQHTTAADTGITYLYHSGANDAARREAQASPAAATISRRYDGVSWLQVGWEMIAPGVDIDSQIRSTAPSRGLSNVYDRLLERIERKIDSIVAGELLLLICASRAGLTCGELVAISGCTAEQAGELAAGLRNHLMVKGGRITLLNDYISRAVEQRYAGTGGERMIEARERIADYLETLPFSPRVAEELPWQLLELGSLDRLERHVTSTPIAVALCEAGHRGDLCLYWNALEGRIDLDAMYGGAGGAKSEPVSEEIRSLLARYSTVSAGQSIDDISIQRRDAANAFTGARVAS